MSKVLLIAPTIDRTDIGEAWVAYQWASLLSERCELTVLTYRKRGRPLASRQLPSARVIEWLEPPLIGRSERLNSLLKPGYFPFAWRAHRWIRRAIRAGEHFDVAHQPVPVAMRYPSPLAGLPVPYVLGPVGGSLRSPPAFAVDDTAPWFTRLRRLDAFRLRRDFFLRRSFRDAACVLGIAPYVGELLHDVPLRRLDFLSETGLAELPELPRRATTTGPANLLFVGRVIRTKGVRDLVRAVSQVRGVAVRADVIGAGFDLENCRELARQLGVVDLVTFHGALPRPDVDEFYRRADVFVFPSFREPGGNVVFEAMGYGLPLIVCNRGGPGAAVDDECALRVDAINPDQYAEDLARAITTLATDPDRRGRMGLAARRRVEAVGLWSSKIDWIERLYEEIGTGRPHQP